MKRNWIVIGFMFLVTVALWAQATGTTPQNDTKATTSCACCNHDAKADGDHATGCCGKDAKACSRKNAKGGCCAGMKKDTKLTTTSASEKPACCGQDCCGKDCCKDGKCEIAKNGKKCCDKCPGMAEGK